jgi:hypothetical protein
VNDLIEECAAFPNGAHDDQVDAMTQALLRWNMVPYKPRSLIESYLRSARFELPERFPQWLSFGSVGPVHIDAMATIRQRGLCAAHFIGDQGAVKLPSKALRQSCFRAVNRPTWFPITLRLATSAIILVDC